MRIAVIAVVASLAACHPPSLADRARAAGGKLAAAGAGLVHVAVKVDASIDPETKAMLVDAARSAARAKVEAVVATGEPIELHHTVSTPATTTPAPVDRGPPPVTTQIKHTTVASPGAALHYQTASGGSACEQHKTMADCDRACTAMLRANMLQRGGGHSCSCLSDTACN